MYFPLLLHTNKVFAVQPGTSYTGLTVNNGEPWSATEGDTTVIVPVAMQLTNMNVIGQSPPGNGQSVTYTVRKNGADTALTVTISDNTTSGFSDAVVSFAAGDTVCFAATATSVANPAGFLDVNMLGIAASQAILSTNVLNSSPSNSAANYALLFGGTTNWSSVESFHKTPFAAAGTLSNLNIRVNSAPGGSAQYVFTIRKNGVDTGLTVTVSGANTSATDSTHSVAVAAGDLISISSTPTTTPTSPTTVAISVAFTPTTAGDCVFGMGATSANGSLSVQNYATTQGTGFSWVDSSQESNIRTYAYPCYLKSFYASLETAPGGAASVTYTIRKNRVNTTLTTTISAAATTGNVSAVVQLSEGDVITMGSLPAGSPAASNKTFGYCLNFTQAQGFYMPF